MIECYDKYKQLLSLGSSNNPIVPYSHFVPTLELVKYTNKVKDYSTDYRVAVDFDNTPVSGVFISSKRNHADSYGMFSVLDPRGFEVHINQSYLLEQLENLTVISGFIQEEILWGIDASTTIMLVKDSPEHIAAVSAVTGKTKGNYITSSNLNIGDVIEISGKQGEYLFLGRRKLKVELTLKQMDPVVASRNGYPSYRYTRDSDKVLATVIVEDNKWTPLYKKRGQDKRWEQFLVTSQKATKVIKNIKVEDDPKIPENLLGYGSNIPARFNDAALLLNNLGLKDTYVTQKVVGSVTKPTKVKK